MKQEIIGDLSKRLVKATLVKNDRDWGSGLLDHHLQSLQHSLQEPDGTCKGKEGHRINQEVSDSYIIYHNHNYNHNNIICHS